MSYFFKIQTQKVTAHIYDNGAGSFTYDANSTVQYSANATLVIKPEKLVNIQNYNPLPSNKSWSVKQVTSQFVDASTVTVNYILDSVTPTTAQSTIPVPALKITLCPDVTNKVIPGSVRFTMAGHVYIDRAGDIYRDIDHLTGSGTLAGTIDYASSEVTLTDWVAGSSDITVQSLLTQFGEWSSYESHFRTAGSPLRPASFYARANKVSDGALMSDTADQDGNLSTGDIEGSVDVNTGVAHIKYGRWVVAAGNEAQDWYDVLNLEYDDFGDLTGNVWQPEYVVPNTSLYNAVTYSAIPVNKNIVGINPTRLPSDGRVPIYRKGGVAVIHETDSETLPDNLAADQIIVLTGSDYSLIELYDQDEAQVDSDLYTVDLATSTVTMANPLDLSAYTEPFIAYKRIEDMKTISDVHINGQLTFTSPLQNAYTENAFCSSALLFGDLASRYSNLFDQQTWTGVWQDSAIGSNASGTYNDLTYPVIVTNNSAINERWALQFTSSTSFNIIGEKVGVIGTGTTSTNVAPINPVSGLPYFIMDFSGFGAGWSTGNAIRFNTDAANAPIWVNRVTMPSNDTLEPTDDFVIQVRGGAS